MIIAHPLNLTVLGFEVTGYGIMMMVAFVVGAWLADRELKRLGFASDYAGDMLWAAVIGGVVGAKLWYVALHGTDALFTRGGLVWYGGFVGGTLAVILNGWRRGVPVRWTGQIIAPVLAAAYAIGRVGCYLVGDDYGKPSSSAFAVAFPEGLPRTTAGVMRAEFPGLDIPASLPPETVIAVHPTQLYEVAMMLFAFALLWRWRTSPRGTGWLLGAYLVMAGIERFIVEFFRAKDDRLLGSMTIAQAFSVFLVLLGSYLIVRWSRAGTVAPGPWLERGVAGRAG
ncbi:MAG: prolipoprotein diacylglyceryl transferase [Gemmatimonadales bacterium]